MNLRHPLSDLDETFTQVRHWVIAENLLSKFFPPTAKNMACEKNSNLRLSNTAVSQKHATSKRLNISTNNYRMFHLG